MINGGNLPNILVSTDFQPKLQVVLVAFQCSPAKTFGAFELDKTGNC